MTALPAADPRARSLLDWYDRHRRDLPWRRSQDPYRIWLSEVMLQQTRVETVLPYYERFLERFPTVNDLAAADEDEVLALWSGLGYYRRARQLHRAARQVADTGEGLPSTLEGLLELPGIGPYTAAAIASIAFDVVEPVLDGNVERVISRLLATLEDPKTSAGRRALTEHARTLLDPRRPGDSNQALMELGATLCVPNSPRCLLCPLKEGCAARAEGEPERYPSTRPRKKLVRVRRAVAVVEGPQGGVLLFRRGDDEELLAGTWELPWVDLPVDEVGPRDSGPQDSGPETTDTETPGTETSGTDGAERQRIERGLAQRHGGVWQLGAREGRVRHGITYRSIEVEIYGASYWAEPSAGTQPAPARAEAGYFGTEARRDLPLSSLVTKVLEKVSG